jgi:D-alanine transaminase
MSRIAYVNGNYVPQAHASVNVEDRGYQFADGVYEVVTVYGGRLIDVELHLGRLDRSLREIRIAPPLPSSALVHVLREVLRRNRIAEGLLYVQITRGVARREHPFPKPGTTPALVVTARRTPPFPASAQAWAASALTQPDLRWARCDIKTVGLLPNVLAKQAAREQGAVEAILIDRDGMVTEGASTNVWLVDEGGELRTRELGHAILPGCTRAALIRLLRDAGIRFSERGFSAAEMRRGREVFLTSATSFVRPITRIDGAAVGEGSVGPVTSRLFDLFARHLRGNSG